MKARVVASGGGAGAVPGLALSPDGRHWLWLNAGQDCGLAPRRRDGERDSAPCVMLTDARPERASSLLDLRNGGPIDLYATPAVFERLTVGLPVLPVLQQYCGVHWRLVAVSGESRHASFRVEAWPTLAFTALSITPHESAAVGDNIALAVHDEASGARLFVAPALGRVGPFEAAWMDDADCLFVAPDADAPEDWAEGLAQLRSPRKLLLQAAGGGPGTPGLELAYEGLEIEL